MVKSHFSGLLLRVPQVTIAKRMFKNTRQSEPEGRETGEKTEVEGMDRGLSTFSPLAPLVRTLGGPNERLCHFYVPGLALIHRTRSLSPSLRPMLSLNDGCQY